MKSFGQALIDAATERALQRARFLVKRLKDEGRIVDDVPSPLTPEQVKWLLTRIRERPSLAVLEWEPSHDDTARH